MQTGGVWVLAREALISRRPGRVALFAAAGAGAAWLAWPRPWVGHVAKGRFNARQSGPQPDGGEDRAPALS